MISLKYKFHVLKRKIADFFEPSKFFLATSSSKSHSFVIWIVMFYLTIFWVRENSIFLFEQRNLVNIKRGIICWVFYNQLLDWRFLFVGYCPGAFSFTNSNITFKSIGDQKSSWVMNLKENSCKNHESLGQKRQESRISRFKWFLFCPRPGERRTNDTGPGCSKVR